MRTRHPLQLALLSSILMTNTAWAADSHSVLLPNDTPAIRKVGIPAGRILSVSPDGRYLSYMPRENYNIDVYESATGKTWTVVKGTSDKYVWDGVIFSPDTSQAAYVLDDSIYVAKIDGSEAKEIHKCEKGPYALLTDWTPDGRKLVAVFSSGTDRIVSVPVDGGTLTELYREEGGQRIGKACLSSNGRYLAIRKNRRDDPAGRISVIAFDSGQASTVTEGNVGALVGWCPDDGGILFLSDRAGVNGLWRINLQSERPVGDPELIKANIGEVSILRACREGSIYYSEQKSSADVYVAAVDFQTGEVLNQPRPLMDRFTGMKSIPVWSKDGKKLMFVVAPGQKRFVAMSLETGEYQEHVVAKTFTSPLQKFAWTADGAVLFVQSYLAGRGHGIHRFELASGTTETFVLQHKDGSGWNCHPRLSPDGKSLYYTRRIFTEDGKEWNDHIVHRNLSSGEEKIVIQFPEKINIWWPFELSPEGTRLALVMSDQFKNDDFTVRLKIFTLAGGATKELLRTGPRENVNSLSWTPDGKRLVFTKEFLTKERRTNDKFEMWSLDVDSGKPVEIKLALARMRELMIHPDGRQLAVQGTKTDGDGQDVWVMQGFITRRISSSVR